MANPEKKNVNSPDETRNFTNGKAEIVNVGGGAVGKFTFQAGWKWSEHIKPVVGTDLCQQQHFGYQVSGQLHVVMADGSEFDMMPGDVGVIPAGHDAWVVGNEPVVTIDWSGAATYAKPS
jgi:hypothetical protein